MKHIFYAMLTPLLIFTFACNKETPEPGPQEMDDPIEENQALCTDEPFQFYIEVNGITLQADSCWVSYIPHDPNNNIIVNEKRAVISWEYPGFPSWNTANSFTFAYGDSESELESGQTYEGRQIIGVVEISAGGSDGQMFGALGEDGSAVFNIDEFNPETGYLCGDFEGRALFTNNEYADFKGNFKGVLNP